MEEYTLVGVDGNAFSVIGYVSKAMRKEGKTKDENTAYLKKAMAGNYDNLLCISMEKIDELNERK